MERKGQKGERDRLESKAGVERRRNRRKTVM